MREVAEARNDNDTMHMEATITFLLPQSDFTPQQALKFSQLIAEKLHATRRHWVCEVLVPCDDCEDAIHANGEAWGHWTDVMRSEVSSNFGEDTTEKIEEAMEITVN